jgi:hypothetical protein
VKRAPILAKGYRVSTWIEAATQRPVSPPRRPPPMSALNVVCFDVTPDAHGESPSRARSARSAAISAVTMALVTQMSARFELKIPEFRPRVRSPSGLTPEKRPAYDDPVFGPRFWARFFIGLIFIGVSQPGQVGVFVL